MALKEVFQHSIALCDIDPQLAGVTCKQVWEALKTAYLNRHEYLDFFLDSKPLKTETVGKKEKIDLEIKLSGQTLLCLPAAGFYCIQCYIPDCQSKQLEAFQVQAHSLQNLRHPEIHFGRPHYHQSTLSME